MKTFKATGKKSQTRQTSHANTRNTAGKPKSFFSRLADVAFVTILATGIMALSTPVTNAQEGGFKIGSLLHGGFGDVTEPMETVILEVLDLFGMADAAVAAENALFDLAAGQIPVISKLEDPFQGNVEDSIAAALNDAQIALQIMDNVTGPAVEIGLDLFMQSLLFSEADFGITLPTGRVKVYRKGLDVSICMTTIGPLGSRVTTGISNMEDLCGNPAPRMSNDTKALTLFTDMAVGYTHVQTRRILIPSLNQPLAVMAPGIVAETYVNINGQWIQLRLAGADTESIELTAEFEVGLKAGVRAEIMAEIGGSAVLSIGVKPAHAGTIIQETVNVMTTLAEAQLAKAIEETATLGAPTDDVLDNAGAVIKAGLDHLQTFSDDPEYEGELGEVSLSIGGSAALGVGIWDTGIAGISAGISVKTALPLEALVSASAAFYSQLLESALDLSGSSKGLFTELVGGTLVVADIKPVILDIKLAASDLVSTVLANLLTLSTKLEMEVGYEVTALGETSDTQSNSIPLLEASIQLPAGDLINTIANEPDALGRALEAAAYLMISGVYPQQDINWSDLTFGIADGVEYTYMSMGYTPLLNVGFSEVKLIDLLEMMELHADYIQPILVGIIQGGVGTVLGQEGSFTPLRTAVENAINELDTIVDETYLKLVKSPRLAFAAGFGANGDLGAEGVLKLGFGARVEGDIKASLLLLLEGRDEYEEEDGTVLANLAVPVNFGAALGASIGEGVEFEITGGGTVTQNLFDFKMTHWNGDLPPPAGMTVNGFEVIEFYGEIRNDESFAGTGFLALPMGGIVEAEFDANADGSLKKPGTWWGGFDLGPLGKLNLASGPFTNAGIEGVVTLPFFDADFTLTSTGWLYGTFDGDLTIGGVQLSAFHLDLHSNGFFAGNGFIDLAGFDADMNASLNNSGFHGDAHLDLFGSKLSADNVSVTAAGATGTFTGNLLLFGYPVTETSLELIDGGLGLYGTAKMDIFGKTGVDVTLLISNGVVTATTATQLSVYGSAIQASETVLTFSKDGVRVYAAIPEDVLATINAQVTQFISDAAMGAQNSLTAAILAVEFAQQEVDRLNDEIAALRITVQAERQKVVDDAAKALILADLALAKAVSDFESLHNALSADIAQLQKDVSNAKKDLQAAKTEVSKINTQIADWDAWYNGLNWIQKAGAWAAYKAYRLTLVAIRDAAYLALDIATAVLSTFETELAKAWKFYDEQINPVKLLRDAKEEARKAAALALKVAELALKNPDTDPRIISLKLLRDIADLLLADAWNFLTGLKVTVGNLAEIAIWINTEGLDLLFRISHASFEANYEGLGPTSFVNMTATLKHMGKEKTITFAFNLGGSLLEAFRQQADLLEQGVGTPTGNPDDTTAPYAEAIAPLDWQTSPVDVTINATDEVGGSGVASITYSATGTQAIAPVTVDADTAMVQINVDGITTLSFFATDVSGNSSLIKTITIKLDQAAPLINTDVPASGVITPGVVTVTAADNHQGSGVTHINLSTTGAETHAPTDHPGATATINISVTGQTTLVAVAYDEAGNSKTETILLTVEDTEPPVVTAPAHILDFEATGVYSIVPIGTATATDNVGVVGITSNAPATFPVGTTEVTWTATDAAGNEGFAIQSVTVVDTTPPVVTAPADIIDYEATHTLSPIAIGTATATDEVGEVTIFNNAPATFPVGTTVVIWTATDTAGNSANAMQIVVVIDTTPPVVTVPADVNNFEATGVLSPVDIGMATATDEVGVVAIGNDAPAAYPVGTTLVVWTAIDAAGNEGTATQRVTVVDTTPPVLVVPPDVVDYEATAILSPVDIGMATATDIVGVVSLVNDAPAAFALGTTVVSWMATDAAGNSTILTQSVTVVDTTAPEIQMPLPDAIFPSRMPVVLVAGATDIFPIAELGISDVDCYKYTKNGKKVSKLGACVFEVTGDTLSIFESGGVGTIIAWTVTAMDENGNIFVQSYAMTVANPGKKSGKK